jgi:hypothetical protein
VSAALSGASGIAFGGAKARDGEHGGCEDCLHGSLPWSAAMRPRSAIQDANLNQRLSRFAGYLRFNEGQVNRFSLNAE